MARQARQKGVSWRRVAAVPPHALITRRTRASE
jgi:hypothetical protein